MARKIVRLADKRIMNFMEKFDLDCRDEILERDIGKVVRFKYEKDPVRFGTLARDHSFTIIGVQRIYDGRHAYRVVCNGYEDDFGRPALPEDIQFVDGR